MALQKSKSNDKFSQNLRYSIYHIEQKHSLKQDVPTTYTLEKRFLQMPLSDKVRTRVLYFDLLEPFFSFLEARRQNECCL